jgi:UDP-N-acetylglucosamine--N-acetylmuramyl-(pentapeptide) pyrophosphoryl-undecaprenol N-acetylglucosamine transferase
MKKILFTGGGSAGHVVPNIALIESLRKNKNIDVVYMGSNGIEKKLIAEQNIPFYEIECPKLIRGGGFSAVWKNLKIPTRFLLAVRQAKRELKRIQPDLVFSKGGYVSLPVVFAAHKLNIPCLAHESDYSAGLANRLAAKKCKKIFTSFPETAQTLLSGEYSGAPIRQSLFTANKENARKAFHIPKNTKVLLVFGGGSGSLAINEAVRANLPILTKFCAVIHVCGKGGIVKKASDRASAVLRVLESAAGCGFKALGVMRSPIDGGDGNREYLAVFKREEGVAEMIGTSFLKDLCKD